MYYADTNSSVPIGEPRIVKPSVARLISTGKSLVLSP
jgi:hypothetical protein